VLCDREPISTWQEGNVVLLGDAAHPTLQYMAQGACMAMEDAVCIAHEVSNTDNIATAFFNYQEKRKHRTARVQIQSRLVGDHIYHPAGGHAALRNAIMSNMSPDDHFNAVNWLYGGFELGKGKDGFR
jgi:3-hydroxybenzoate 6-monooxygenase